MASLLTSPPEIRSRIFQECDSFKDVIAFALACKSLYRIWESESPAIIWSVGNEAVIAFDVALLAVHMLLITFICD
jgi:hypothetical protein